MVVKKPGIGTNQTAQPVKTGAPTTAQTSQSAEVKKTDDVSLPKDVALTSGEIAPRLLQAARARDVNEVKNLVIAWTQAQDDYDTIAGGLEALGNFLRVYGSGEENPKLYANIMSLEIPKDTPFSPGTLELKGNALDQLGGLLQGIGKGHLSGELDLQAGENTALKSLLIASSMGMQTDALKVKMAGWNELTPQLKTATTSFELGIRRMPKDKDTNFWVVGGVNKAVDWIKNLRVSPEGVEFMKSHPLFAHYPKQFFDYFSAPTDNSGKRVPGQMSQFEKDIKHCKIEGLQDGEIYMGGPLMRVTGPPAAVEFLETNLMRLVTSWTTVATAASQMTLGAGGKPVAYFGPRRAPGGEDTTEAISQAASIGGMTVSSDLMAGYLGQAITGTMEHSIMLMLKTIFKADPPAWVSDPKIQSDGKALLRAAWQSSNPEMSSAELDTKVDAQIDDLMAETHIFKNYAYEYDREKSVALVDTSHPNVGTAAAMLAQKLIWKEHGDDKNMFAIRLDSGCLLAQGLQFRRLFNQQGMGHFKTLATDGLLPETVKFFEAVEDGVERCQKSGKLDAEFKALIDAAPPSAIDGAEEKAEVLKMAAALVADGMQEGQAVFTGYGAGEKIADSVSTVGRPGIVYKASKMTFKSESTGEDITVDMGKIPNPGKATGPNRQLLAKVGPDGKFQEWVIASPDEKPGRGWQKQMRVLMEDGQVKVNTSQEKAVEYGAARRAMLPDDIAGGATPKLGMTEAYKLEWLEVVRKTDPSRVDEYREFFDSRWPTVDVMG